MSGRSPQFLKFTRALLGLAAVFSIVAAPITAAAQQRRAPTLIRDTEIEAILRTDSEAVLRAAGLNPDDVTIHLVADPELNAFVSGGQNIFFHTGLIIETDTPNELIGVIAHETGHIAGGHIARSGAAARSAMAPLLLGMGLGVLAALAGAPDAAAGLIYSSTFFAQLSVLGYTRIQESAADQAAMSYLDTAGISGRGLVEFFDNFRFQEVLSEARRYPYFQSHPLSGERIEALRLRAERSRFWTQTDTPAALASHEVMRAKLRGFLNPPSQTLNEYPETDRSFPARYARAIAYYRNTETQRALTAIDALLQEQPNNPYLWELKGQVLFESGRAAEAVPAHARSVELRPDAALLQINLGQALLALDDPRRVDEAITHINRAMALDNENPLGWRLLAEAYDRKGEPGMARLAAAEQNFALGQLGQARVFAMRAREILPSGTPQHRRATDIIMVSNPSNEDLRTINNDTPSGPRGEPSEPTPPTRTTPPPATPQGQTPPAQERTRLPPLS